MPAFSDLICHHIDYNVWATNRLLHIAQGLSIAERIHDFKTADRSVQGPLTHLLRSERTWLSRIQHGTPNRPHASSNDEEWETLLTEWPKLHQQWRAWAQALTCESAEAILTYPDLKNFVWQQPLWQIILHVVNHSTHHRGQVSGFLRALGRTPPALDFIAFVRQGSIP